ncbi:ArnT family glycosyltransferase [Cellvibrio fibrivorans]|uniref:4-amino-4-deoxy-L-arabinose transferase-like glycosyltransferase n=1 Tax=Cellvibrio fibrivorans TaxID=126350 RepID=A0ABU1UTI1_9GAMM|nr:glycosyltransferase family 39 protein [Cellvibrio fibrivorans]MDR7088447.1 4-amino-4-deoxy-L-arabinose transferase-like glycosyltransferase [Cellvibrio fibrivorans]
MRALDNKADFYQVNTWRVAPWLVDAFCIGGLVISALIALLWNYQGLPMQYWDESRNANNALEMALGSGWLVPTYEGVPDHWNTKPPLLIWLIAGLMKLDLPPLLALRLPSALAAAATLIMVWAAVRFGLRDRLAALIAAALLLSSKGYTGIHGAHTGDFDTLLALFTTGYVLSVWQALAQSGRQKIVWMLSTGIFLVLAVMTKGPAGFFGVVGLCLFLLLTGQVLNVINDWRWWLVAIFSCLICASYYIVRESYDAGYLQAVWMNELGGRYSETNESHYKGTWFYLRELLKQWVPGCLFLLLLGYSLLGADATRKRLAQITFLSGAGILILLTTAKTQLHWYLIPVIPLLCIAAAIALVDAIKKGMQVPINYWRAFLVMFIALPVIISVYRNAISLPAKSKDKTHISQYGILFNHLHTAGRMPNRIIVLDDGADNTAGFTDYNPELKFYAQLEKQKGIDVQVARLADANLVNGLVATCDYKNMATVRQLITAPLVESAVCVAGYKDRQ